MSYIRFFMFFGPSVHLAIALDLLQSVLCRSIILSPFFFFYLSFDQFAEIKDEVS
jgi:hypothetical protein